MAYLWQSEELICYDVINPIQYVFHEDTETCTPVYTTYYEDYKVFYKKAIKDIEDAKETREYLLDAENHPNWFDAFNISLFKRKSHFIRAVSPLSIDIHSFSHLFFDHFK